MSTSSLSHFCIIIYILKISECIIEIDIRMLHYQKSSTIYENFIYKFITVILNILKCNYLKNLFCFYINFKCNVFLFFFCKRVCKGTIHIKCEKISYQKIRKLRCKSWNKCPYTYVRRVFNKTITGYIYIHI